MSRTRAITPEEFDEWKSRYDVIRQLAKSYINSAEPKEIDRIWWELRMDLPEEINLLKFRALPLHLAYLEHAIDPAAFGYNAGWESAWHSPQRIVDAFTALQMRDEFESWARKFIADLDTALSKAAAERGKEGAGLDVYEILMLPARARIYEAFGEEAAREVKLETIEYMIEQLPEVHSDKLHRARMIVDEVAKLSRELGSYDRAIDAIDIAIPMFESAREKAELRAFQADLYEESGDQENANAVRATAIAELQAHLEGAGAPGGKDELGLLARLCEKTERYSEAINYYTAWYEQASTSPKVILLDESGTVVGKETPGEREYIEARTSLAQKLLTEEQAALFEKSTDNLRSLMRPFTTYFDDHQKLPDDLSELVQGGYIQDPSTLNDPVTGQPYKYTPGLSRWDLEPLLRSASKHSLATVLTLRRGPQIIWVEDSPKETE